MIHANQFTFSRFNKLFYYMLVLILLGCIEPEEPKFEYRDGLIYIDAFASTVPNASFVLLSEFILKSNQFINETIKDADVAFRNTKSNKLVVLTEQGGQYLPPEEFIVKPGESWELLITLQDGKRYQSLPEIVANPVSFSNIKATYNPELAFNDERDSFVPGHFISIDIQDPPGENNFYLWKFRSFERLIYCERCENGIFRNGECVDNPIEPPNSRDYVKSYICEEDCWRIRYNENIKIFADQFIDGLLVKGLPVANIFLYNKLNIAIEFQQFSVSESAYGYYNILKDLVDNSGGFNAPPPAALIGNLFNSDDNQEYVLGRFTAAATVTESLFIERKNINEGPEGSIELIDGELECCPFPSPNDDTCKPLIISPCPEVITATCSETRYRTSIKPEAWID